MSGLSRTARESGSGGSDCVLRGEKNQNYPNGGQCVAGPGNALEFDFDFHRVNNPELAGLSKDETSAMIKAGNRGKNAPESC